jgi:hypothetical protein
MLHYNHVTYLLQNAKYQQLNSVMVYSFIYTQQPTAKYKDDDDSNE